MIRLLGLGALLYFVIHVGAWPPVAAGAACGLAMWAVRSWRTSRPYRPRLVAARPVPPPVVQLPVAPAQPPAGVADLASYRQRRAAS